MGRGHSPSDGSLSVRMVQRAALCVALGLVVAGAVWAGERVTHEQAGFSFEVPDGWSAKEPDDDGILSVTAPENAVVLQVWSEKSESLEKAMEELGEELGKQLQDVKIDDETKELEINGVEAVALTGDAKVEGNPIKLLIVICMGEHHPVVFLGMAVPATLDKYNPVVSETFKTIRRVG